MPGIQSFQDKNVVITGAGSGIGRATAVAFAKERASVIIADINVESLDKTKSLIESEGGRAHSYPLDVANREEVNEFAKKAIADHGAIHVLFNNAGVGVSGSITETPIHDWEWLVNINYWGVIYGIQAFAPHMIENRQGHILNTASMAGLVPAPPLGAYCSTKHALVGLGQTLRIELKPHNVGVTTICPGIIKTNIPHATRNYIAQEDQDKIIETFEKRAWPPERVANAVLKAVRKNKSIVPVGPEAWIAWYLNRLSPSLASWFIDSQTKALRTP